MDRGTVIGVIVAVSGVVAGLLLDGGSLKQILQPTAALIVLGGTLGAVMIQFPLATVLDAVKHLRETFFSAPPLSPAMIEDLIRWCHQARKHGILVLDRELETIEDQFLKKALTLAVDGVNILEIRETMERDLDLDEEKEEGISKVLESAGGFAPTLGIIGAVLGLIQVMQKMDNVSEIGKGIAVAFVSTLYGIGVANLVFLPLAGKLRIRVRERQLLHEMTLDAVIAIAQDISPRALRQRLQGYITAGKLTPQSQAQAEMVSQ